MIRLLINGVEADTTLTATKISLTAVIKDFTDVNKATGSYSLPFQLPFTNKNKQLFNHAHNIQTNGKFNITYQAQIYDDNVLLFDGVYVCKQVLRSKQVFDGYVYATNIERIADILPDKATLNQIKSFELFDFTGNATVLATCKDAALKYVKGSSYHNFTYLFDSFYNLTNPRPFLQYDYFGLSAFTGGILEKIFEDAGYTVEGDVLDVEEWKRLTLVYTDNGLNGYNYAVLAPLTTQIAYVNYVAPFTVEQISERDNDFVYVINYAATVATGDLANCFFGGVYTAKYTGDYEISVGGTAQARLRTNGGYVVPSNSFTVLREIDNADTITADSLPGAGAGFTAANTFDTDIIISDVQGRSLVKLKQGVQYRVQTYVCVSKQNVANADFFVQYNAGYKFIIHTCAAKDKINLADFLSTKIKQIDFVALLFKLFNLYYVLDKAAKKVKLYTRDEFFALKSANILDLSNYTDINVWDDTPFTQDDKDNVFYTFANDSGDFILSATDYYSKVTVADYNTAKSLIVAPVSYIQQQVKGKLVGGVLSTAEDILPTAIAANDSIDDSLLMDESGTSFGYEAKIGFYYSGEAFYDTQVKTDLVAAPNKVFHPLLFTFKPDSTTTADYCFYPKLFFDAPASQVAYKIVRDTVRRSFSLVEATTPTIWETVDADLLTSTVDVPTLSLNPNTENSLFQQLYAANIRTSNLSNYVTGDVHLSSTLYSKVKEGIVIKIDNGFYIVDTISDYVAGGTTAKLKVYKYV